MSDDIIKMRKDKTKQVFLSPLAKKSFVIIYTLFCAIVLVYGIWWSYTYGEYVKTNPCDLCEELVPGVVCYQEKIIPGKPQYNHMDLGNLTINLSSSDVK